MKQMKKLIVMMMLAIITMAATVSCSSETDSPTPTPEEVSVKLDYAFFEQGSMSRSGESVYESFYNNYVKTKVLAPKKYNLTFKKGGDAIRLYNGEWGKTDLIKAPTGSYQIVGESYPNNSSLKSDSLFLKFDEQTTITAETKGITLTAKYDCFLLLFDASNISKISAYYNSGSGSRKDLVKKDGVFYLFATTTESPAPLMIDIERPSGMTINIVASEFDFEKGKYYYFNDITNSFDIDPMVSGN